MKTIDLLLAQPVTRARLVLDRYATLLPLVVLMMLALLVGIFVGTQYLGISASYPWFACALGLMGQFMLAFGAISLFVSAVLSDGRVAALVSLGLLLIMYFMETIGDTVEKLSPIRSLSLYHYAHYNDVLIYHNLSPGNVAILVIVAGVFLVLALLAFRRRDINVS
jgi:ABC-2 type transport system permease protein